MTPTILKSPNIPTLAPEDRLTWVETTYTEVYSDGSSTDKSYMLFEYDAEGLLTGYDQYDYDSEQTDKINAPMKGRSNEAKGKSRTKKNGSKSTAAATKECPFPTRANTLRNTA